MTRRGWMEKMTAVKCRCEMLNWADDDWIKDPIISVILVYQMQELYKITHEISWT